MSEDGTYRLLDSGFGRKLEALGAVVVDRQSPGAVWKPRLDESEWARAAGRHIRSDRGGGHWEWHRNVPESWTLTHGDLTFRIKPTPFGHAGVFAEQADQWAWLRQACARLAAELGREPRLLNLFAYTGGSTLAAAQAGAAVTHVDAARGIVDWARSNAEINGLADTPIRWIVDDCIQFCARENRRETRYDGVILDPPSFGRGKKGEVWKIDRDLLPLLDVLFTLCDRAPRLVLLTCHTPGYTPLVLENVLRDRFPALPVASDRGEMIVPELDSDRVLPAGSFARVG